MAILHSATVSSKNQKKAKRVEVISMRNQALAKVLQMRTFAFPTFMFLLALAADADPAVLDFLSGTALIVGLVLFLKHRR